MVSFGWSISSASLVLEQVVKRVSVTNYDLSGREGKSCGGSRESHHLKKTS